MKRMILVVILCSLMISPARAQDTFPREVRDPSGATVTVPARPSIVAVVGDTALLQLLLPADAIRPVDPTADLTTLDWTDIGLFVIPDLYAAAYPDLFQAAQDRAVPVFQTIAISSLYGWRTTLTSLGQATGHEDAAAGVLARLDRRLDAVQQATAGREPVHILALTPEGYTFGEASLFTELVEAADGLNVAATARIDDFRQVDDKTIQSLAPEVILLSPAWTDEEVERFTANRAYVIVPAVRAGRVYRLPFSPTLPDDPGAAVVALAIYLHPTALLLS
jgi:ABC-type Fe3+-hydroxamate transport system substrate-binding protein